MLYDSTLSNPPGYACGTCHVAETGYTGPNSEINAFSGPQPGIVPSRFSDRKPQSIAPNPINRYRLRNPMKLCSYRSNAARRTNA
jgi:cytochrome c peroxidase